MEKANPTVVDQFADFLARGSLTLSEVAGFVREELDAIFELGARHLDTDRHDEAETLFGALLTLFPYEPKYWRAYGIALHQGRHFDAAAGAYSACLLLSPDDLMALCYRGEVLLYLGRKPEGIADLQRVVQGTRLDMMRRAQELLALANAPHYRMPDPAPFIAIPGLHDAQGFTLHDGRTLPLDDSPFSPAPPAESLSSDAAPQTRAIKASTFVSVVPVFEDENFPDDEITHTAIVRRRGQRREKLPTPRARTSPSQERPASPGEITQTAVLRRRHRLPLHQPDPHAWTEEEATVQNTPAGSDASEDTQT